MSPEPARAHKTIALGEGFELDPRRYQLRRADRPLRLERIPMEILLLLVERPGDLVTREEIAERVWGAGVFLDTDNSINGAIRKIRQVLKDDPEQPRFVQTITGKGYRFVAPVPAIEPVGEAAPPQTPAGGDPIGKKIAHYRVLQLLGGGGMGVVYKAEDLKLGRAVAIKFLPLERANDPRAFARFEHEARAASALDHPNICSIYELGEYDGQPFIVMQLLQGQTLREWMETRTGPFSGQQLDQILDIADQILGGLDTAHDKGIVHRDVKPANIFVTKAGQAKILDFGIAKFLDPPGEARAPSDGVHDLGSVANPIPTRTGGSGGTPSYLSPEQIRGEPLDRRTDLFSFGLVLFELATGQRAFDGDTVPAIHDAVLNRPALGAGQMRPELPAELERIIEKALAKDREARYQSASEIRADIRQLQRGRERSRSITSRGMARAREDSRLSRLSGWSIGMLALTVVLAGFGIRALMMRGRAEPFQDFTMTQVTETGKATGAAISPDARYVASVQNDNGAESLWLRNIATGSDTQILPPSSAPYQQLAFSPDGNYVYFLKRTGPSEKDLYRVPVLGGTPHLVTRDVDTNVTFSPDARQIAWVRANDPEVGKFLLLLAEPDGSRESVVDARKIETHGNNGFPRTAAWSSDGSRIAYSYGRYAAESGTLYELDLRTKRQKLLARAAHSIVFEVAWLSENRLLALYSEKGPGFLRRQIGVIAASTEELRPVSRDTNSYSTLTLSGDRRAAATVQQKTTRTLEFLPDAGLGGNGKRARPPVERVSAFDWTADGQLIVSDGPRLVRLGPDGTPTTLINDVAAATLSLASCANGYLLVNWAFRSGADGDTIWRLDRDGGNPAQLSRGSSDTSPVCSPDGKWAYYLDSLLKVMRVPVEGGNPEVVPIRNVPNTYEHLGGIALSADGRQLMLIAVTSDLATQREHDTIEIVDLNSDSELLPHVIEPVVSMTPSLLSAGPRFSPDGKGIVYPFGNKGVSNLWMQPLDGSPGRRITEFSSGRINEFRWSPDGRTLAVKRETESSDVVLLRQTQ